MIDCDIAFVGGGNMCRSLVGGLVSGGCPPQRIRVSDPDAEQTRALAQQFQIRTFDDNREAARGAGVVVFAVKPQVFKSAAIALGPTLLDQDALIVTIAAGIREPDIVRWIGGDVPVVRAMPNTPALVQSGATALYANRLVSGTQKDMAESILRAVGLTVWLHDEQQMDAVTALSGSGPAYFFLVMEAMQAAGVKMGLTEDTARLLTLQTAFGAAKLALESREDAHTLRERVTSPGGTTERAVQVLVEGGVEDLFLRALNGARERSDELARAFGSDA